MISVVPERLYPHNTLDQALTLEAVDGNKIKTFGKVDIRLNFSGKTYRHKAIVANIDESILGWDFMRAKQLNLEWHDNVCYLVDNKASFREPTTIDTADSTHRYAKLRVAGTSPRVSGYQVSEYKSFQQYAQQESAKSTPKERKPIPQKYQALLDKYPEILEVNFKAKEAKHGVQHVIDTGSARPVQAKVRNLMPGSPMEIEVKKIW